jgi:hypothetical protein
MQVKVCESRFTSTPSTLMTHVSLKARSELGPDALSDVDRMPGSVTTDSDHTAAAPGTLACRPLPSGPV